MRHSFIFLIISLIIGTIAYTQKVAGYSYGKPGKDDYEQFSFWVNANKRSDIFYSYGKDSKEVKLKYIGKDILNGDSCFKVQFSNNYILYIIPKGNNLKVSDLTGKYCKTFSWEYEGPVNGIGTFCEPCAEDEDAAIKLVRDYYLK